ncbi:MAG: hypothetical protein JXL84_24485 [Deltaproteobacteria bacterium]|nr:hypothetical protein [Deltaproteobacteria bacterium]
MVEAKSVRRFGAVAIEKGFITKDQFVEAMAMQIDGEMEGGESRAIGSILEAMGYMTSSEVDEVLKALGPERSPA